MFHDYEIDSPDSDRAALYMRMSTEDQEFSPEVQRQQLYEHAESENTNIVKEYLDSGVSGLTAKGRDQFNQLMEDVQNNPDFNTLYILDMSRMGRFQDNDEFGHYLRICNKNGVKVKFLMGNSVNEQGLLGDFARIMEGYSAANESKVKSEKVWYGQKNLILKGFRQGGIAGYGIQRVLIDNKGIEKQKLYSGDRKSLVTDRVVLKKGDPNEVSTVEKIYNMFLSENMTYKCISEKLNESQTPFTNGENWSSAKVKTILTNRKYVGDNIFNRSSNKLKTGHIKNPQLDWIINEDCLLK